MERLIEFPGRAAASVFGLLGSVSASFQAVGVHICVCQAYRSIQIASNSKFIYNSVPSYLRKAGEMERKRVPCDAAKKTTVKMCY